MKYAISIQRRSITEVFYDRPFKAEWRYYRFKWTAKFVVWWINTLGAGKDFERARYLGVTL